MVQPAHWSNPLRGVTRNSEAAKRFVLALDDGRGPRIAQAHALAEIDLCRHYRYAGAGTLGEYGERYGLSGPETRRLAQAGHAIKLIPGKLIPGKLIPGKLIPGLEASLRGGEVSFESAQALWLTCRPRTSPEGDLPADPKRPPTKWLELARNVSTENFCRVARYDRRRRRLGEPPVDLDFLISSDLLERFRRVKTIAQHPSRSRRPSAR